MLAIIEPFSGIAGDMFLGALIDLGLEEQFVHKLPAALGLEGIGVRVARVQRSGIAAVKVDFDIPPQPHGRHLKHLIEIVERSSAPASVKARAADAFSQIANIEASVHGTTVTRVHLHEVGAVDAILDIVGSIWGADQLGLTDVRCAPIALGDGFAETSHGLMPVPAPATARLLEGLTVMPGPAGSGELTTPTGALLARVLSRGSVPGAYVPRRVGYGAGTKDFPNRPNVLRIVLADAVDGERETLALLTADIDDATPEHLAAAGDALRAAGALDVTMASVLMKKGRPGTRVEVLSSTDAAVKLEETLLTNTPTIGVRRTTVTRRVLNRVVIFVEVLGHRVSVKRVTLPDGTTRDKPEADDVAAVAAATGRPVPTVFALAMEEARQTPMSV